MKYFSNILYINQKIMRTEGIKAALIVDYQKAFATKKVKELYVNGWEILAPIINEVVRDVKSKWWIILSSRDIHRSWNISFAQNFKWKVPITESIRNWLQPWPQNFITLTEIKNWTEQNNWLEDTAWFTVYELKAYLSTLENQTMALWPVHCVANTSWAEYQEWLDTSQIDIELIKWYNNAEHPYSAFPWIEIWTTRDMLEVLKEKKVKKIKLTWLAADWCVLKSAIDIVWIWWIIVEFIKKATKAVSPENEIEYLGKMREAWVIIIEG